MNHWHDHNMGILKPALSYWSLTCQHLSIYHHITSVKNKRNNILFHRPQLPEKLRRRTIYLFNKSTESPFLS